MKRTGKQAVLAMLALAAGSMLSAAIPSAAAELKAKPQLPVRIEITAADKALKPQNIRPGDIVELRIKAAVMTAADEVRITAEPYDGAELVSGTPSWSGKAAKGQGNELVIGVRAPADGTGKVKATVRVFRGGRQIMKRETRYFLGGGPSGPGAPPAGGMIKKDSKGRDIVEY